MTEQQFKRATEIATRLTDLGIAKQFIDGRAKHKLSYAVEVGNDYHLCSDWGMKPISSILDKHDRMIRQEIDDEISLLKEEIKKL